ncbi:MAG: serine hydrolase [Proteobacteria bacterium]|nr:serine hydrolase [Pseudomonadota bacterium]
MKIEATRRLTFGVIALLAGVIAAAAPLKPTEIDRLARQTMAAFSVPGIAVGVVKDGRLVFARGYGVRALGQPGAVDPDTVFAIGSNTKAFTSAALAILVDEGKLGWDDRVIDHLPDFRMSDPYVTREFTVRDLLTHRSGLGLGAGDLLFVTPTDFTRTDLVHALRYLKPVTSFRSQFAYDNLMYAVAGEVVAPVAGESWEAFVTRRILKPLHMDQCAVNAGQLPPDAKLAAPHVETEGRLQRVPPLEIPAVAPAGAIQCNVTGLSRWVATQLGHGIAPDGTRLFSESQAAQMWTPQTLLPTGSERDRLTGTHFAAYGLGWGLEDFEGYKRVSHDGGLPGMVTHVGMIPELNVGVIVLTNQQEGAALEVLSLSILEGYTGAARHDWLKIATEEAARRKASIRESDARRAPPTSGWQPADPGKYAGTYNDPWRGNVTIAPADDGLRLTFSHTQDLSGRLTPVGINLFVVRWDDRTLDADAYVHFTSDFSGAISGFTMEAVSDSTDFSFDFQDLNFTRVAAGTRP